MNLLIQIIVYGFSLSMLYFLLSSGFSLIFGLMGVMNFSHGSMFMWGCYITYFVYMSTGNIWAALLAGAIGIGVMGLLMERFLIRPLKGNHMSQILLTFGLVYILDELAKIVFGTRAYIMNPPDWLQGSIPILSENVPKYRLFMIVSGVIIFILMNLLLKRTKLGLVIRAGIEKPRMVQAVGINVQKIFTVTFALGCALAGLGGAVATPFLGAYATIGTEQIFNAVAVVIVGGMGSFSGSFYASLILGFIQYIVSYFVPELSMVSTLVVMFIVIILKPRGLFGGKA